MQKSKLEILKELFNSGVYETEDKFDAFEKRLEIELNTQNQTEGELVNGASLLRSFDERIYETVLQTFPDPTLHKLSFAEFIKSTKLEPVPRAFNVYRVKEDIKQTNLARLSKELPDKNHGFLSRLKNYYLKYGDELDLLSLEIITKKNKAQTTFIRLFTEADEKFDLARCNDYICVLIDYSAFLSEELQDLLEQKQQYLRTRNYFTSEYYKTVFYQSRESISKVFEDLLNPKTDDSNGWIFQLFAKGGMGKTMFVRWLISRFLVPRKVPVARLDFDFLDLQTVSNYPWLLVFAIIEQLNFQIKGSPFSEILKSNGRYISLLRDQNSDSENQVRKNIESELKNYSENQIETTITRITNILSQTNSDKPFIVILDTLERITLYYNPKFVDILKSLEKLFLKNPKMRLLLSGRYDVIKSLKKFKTDFAAKTTILELRPFNVTESNLYLSEKRKIQNFELVKAIIDKCKTEPDNQGFIECNPFKLSLLADFYQQGIAVTPDAISALPQTDYEYLIYRIILHIKETEVRWLLRYAVIPREFSFDFYENVLASHLEKELLENRGLDKAESEFSKDTGIISSGKVWQKTNLINQKLDLEQIWRSLKNYASGYGWIMFDENDQNLLRLQPDVVVPMRLLIEKEEIFTHIHQNAVEYFATKAKKSKSPHIWARNIKEAIYHRFQISKVAAEKYWQRQLNSPKSQKEAEIYKQISEAILSQDFVDENGSPLKRIDGKTFIVSPQIIYEAHARSVEASILLMPTLKEEKVTGEWQNIIEHLVYLQTFESKNSVVYKKSFEIKALLKLAKHFAESSNNLSKQISLLKKAISVTSNDSMIVNLEFLLAEAYSKSNHKNAIEHYQNALTLREKVHYPQIKKSQIYLALGNSFHNSNDFDAANLAYENALQSARFEKDFSRQAEILQSLSNLSISLGKFDKAYYLLQIVKKISPKTGENALINENFICQMEARSFYNPLQSFYIIKDFYRSENKLVNARVAEIRADIWGMLMQYDLALKDLENAMNLWEIAADRQGEFRCQLLRINYLLFSIGNFDQANYYLKNITLSQSVEFLPEDKFRLEFFHVYYQFKNGHSVNAQINWQKMLNNQEFIQIPTLFLQVLAIGIAFKFAGSKIVDKFIVELEKIKPVSARLPLIDIFSLAEQPFLTLKSEQKSRIKKSIEIKSTGHDIIPHALFQVSLLNYCGFSGDGENLLKKAEIIAKKQKNFYVLKQIFSAKDGLQVDSLDDIRQTKFFDNFSSYPEISFSAYVEQAARFLKRNNLSKCQECLVSAGKLLKKRDQTTTQIEALYYELLAEVALNKDKLKYRNEALRIFQSLGQIQNVKRLETNENHITKKIDLTGKSLVADSKNVLTINLDTRDGDIYSTSGFGDNSSQKVAMKINSPMLEGSPILDFIRAELKEDHWLYRFANDLTNSQSQIMQELQQILFFDKSIKQLLNQSGKSKSLDLRLDAFSSSLAKIPWELAKIGHKFITTSFNHLYRSNSTITSNTNYTKWFQIAIRKFVNSTFGVDGNWGPKTQSELDNLKKILKLPKNVSDDILRSRIIKYLVSHKIKSRTNVLIIKAGREARITSQRGSVSFLELAYGNNSFEITNLSAENLYSFPKVIMDKKPEIIHICSSFRPGYSSREVQLEFLENINYEDNLKQDSSRFSASYLANTLGEIYKNKLQPLIILDAVCPKEMSELVLQMMYRNIFANDLFQIGGVSAIIAMGLSINQELKKQIYDSSANSLSNSETFGSIVKKLREFSKSTQSLQTQIPTQGIAFFTNEPDLTILTSEAN